MLDVVGATQSRVSLRASTKAKRVESRLDYFELTDFKSYGGTHVIGPFKPTFNCIVGPNGSGKSNLMDALCFVLGVETRHLRGIKMADLGHRKERDPPDTFRKASVAMYITTTKTATATQENSAEKNTAEKQSRGDTERDVAEAETGPRDGKIVKRVKFERRVVSERSSQFLIDNVAVEKTVYFQHLGKLNVLPKVLNCVVTQGQVETISLKSDKERAQSLDEISGSAQYKTQYENLKQEISDLNLELRKANMHKSILDNEKKTYKKQLDELVAYETEQEKMKDLQSQLFLFRLFVNETFGQRLGMAIEEGQGFIERETNQMKHLEGQIRSNGDERSGHLKQISEKEKSIVCEAKRVSGLEKQRADVEEEVKRCASEIQSLKDEMVTVEKRKELIYNEYMMIATEWEKLLEKREVVNTRYNSKFEKNVYHRADEESRHTYEKAKRGAAHLTRQIQATIHTLGTTHSMQNEKFRIASEKLQREEGNLKTIQDDLVTTKARHEVLMNNQREQESNITDLLKEREESEKNLQQTRNEMSKVSRDLGIAEQSLDDFVSSGRETQTEVLKRTAVEALTAAVGSGVMGRVISLIELAEPKYASCVSSSLGAQGDSIVVDTFETAKKCVRVLREKKLPFSEFFPLDNLRRTPFNAELKRYDALFRPVIDCIHFDQKILPVLEQILEDTVVVSTLDKARDLAFRKSKDLKLSLKVVTLDGSRIGKDTNISVSSGHQRGGQGERFMAKNSEPALQEKVNALRSKRTILLKEIDALQQRNYELQDLTASSQSRLHRFSADLDICTASLKSLHSKEVSAEEQIRELTRTMKETQLKLTDAEKALRKSRQEEAKVQAEAFKSDVLKKMRTAETEYLQLKSELTNLQTELAEQESDLDLKLLGLLKQMGEEDDLEGMTSMDKMGRLEGLLQGTAAQDRVKKKLSDLEIKRARAEKKSVEAKFTLDSQSERLKVLKSEVEDLQKLVEGMGKMSDKLGEELQAVEKRIYDTATRVQIQKREYELLDEKATELLTHIVTENIHIPTLNGTFDDLKALHKGESIEDLEVEPDFESLRADLKSVEQRAAIEKKDEEITKEIESIETKLEEYRPNFMVRESYAESTEKYKQAVDASTILQKEKHLKESELHKCRDIRAEKFKRCFTHTKREVERIYNELTKGTQKGANFFDVTPADAEAYQLMSKHFNESYGGRALLELEEDVCSDPFDKYVHDPVSAKILCACRGVLFHAIPPDKRYTEMDASFVQLSGGEKSMASLALLFAWQSYRQSPFVVLDEVDAALDAQNVESLRSYLQHVPFQIIAVTLKEEMYCHADAIIGVYKDHVKESSGTVALDVSQYTSAKSGVP